MSQSECGAASPAGRHGAALPMRSNFNLGFRVHAFQERGIPPGAGFAVQPCAGFFTTWWVLLARRRLSRRRWSWRR